LAYLFELSRRAGLARGHEEVPGLNGAIGVLMVIFFVRAAATEYVRGSADDLKKDLLWGLTLGTAATLLSRM